MANILDVRLVVKHLANGSFGENLCRVCMAPLTDVCENVFTSICKEGKEYCIADVLKEICDIKISDSDHYNVCAGCFVAATNAYKFYLNAKVNNEVLHFYVDELGKYLHSLDIPEEVKAEPICVSLPLLTVDYFDYEVKDISCKKLIQEPSKETSVSKKPIPSVSKTNVKKSVKEVKLDDDEIVVIINEKGVPSFFKVQPDGTLVKKEYDVKCKKAYEAIAKTKENSEKKTRRKREPMIRKKCPRCPIRYRFIAKLRQHMRSEHGVVLYACKICEALTEDIGEYEFHLKTHTNNYECDICKVMFKKREIMIDHLKEHKETGNGSVLKSDYVCVVCGLLFADEDGLRSHTDLNHYKKYACYYCGRTYKGVSSFEKHVKKHEMCMKQDTKRKPPPPPAPESRWTCELCGRGFRGERALLWHARLHTDERPFTCDVCGRGFVSLNRRNQHALCAHSAPARRCPLCPALFHLRSMVNTHIKKVHLKRHKRRTRAVRQQHVFWQTAPVPVQELSVALQNDILELQAANAMAAKKDFVLSEVGNDSMISYVSSQEPH